MAIIECIHVSFTCAVPILVNCYMYVKMYSCVSRMLLDTNPTHYPIYRYIGNIKFTIIDMQNFDIAQH